MSIRRMICGIGVGAGLAAGTGYAAEPPLTVFVAASLAAPMKEAAAQWETASGRPVKIVADASGALARQLEQGAPADVFISAAEDWMAREAGAGVVDSNSVRVLFGNHLVVVASAEGIRAPGTPAELALAARIAVGDPATVPVGRYAQAFLQQQPWRASWTGALVYAGSAPAALALVEHGGADAGIVYRSDAAASRRVRIGFEIGESSHPPIRYPAAVVAHTTNRADAESFLVSLRSPDAAAVFHRAGFEVIAAP